MKRFPELLATALIALALAACSEPAAPNAPDFDPLATATDDSRFRAVAGALARAGIELDPGPGETLRSRGRTHWTISSASGLEQVRTVFDADGDVADVFVTLHEVAGGSLTVIDATDHVTTRFLLRGSALVLDRVGVAAGLEDLDALRTIAPAPGLEPLGSCSDCRALREDYQEAKEDAYLAAAGASAASAAAVAACAAGPTPACATAAVSASIAAAGAAEAYDDMRRARRKWKDCVEEKCGGGGGGGGGGR